MRDSRSATRGFTLVELLVVIGIIALLISILLPALNKAREQANSARCASNMRTAMQALHLYTTQYRGWLPGPTTSGAVWKSGGAAIGANDTSLDTTPLQNMDWVSPTYGLTFKWPENDYQRLRTILNVDLKCPTNSIAFNSIYAGNGLPYTSGDLTYASYSAVIQFHAFPSKDSSYTTPPVSNGLPPIVGDMYAPNNGGLRPPTGYAPMLTKVGPAASKVFLIEGARYVPLINEGSFNAAGGGDVSFNAIRYQRQGGNFMIGGPYQPWGDTPYQLYEGNSLAYTTKKLSPVARNLAWRHAGKMNLAFFDGHVELRAPADSIQVDLYVPRGTTIIDSANTYDPKDSNNQVVN